MNKMTNPRIQQLLNDLNTLNTFAGAAAQSAAQEIPSPVGIAVPTTPVLEDLIGAYKADEQADRGALFKGAIAKMKEKLAELEGLDVLVDSMVAPIPGTAPVAPAETAPAPAMPMAPVEPPAAG